MRPYFDLRKVTKSGNFVIANVDHKIDLVLFGFVREPTDDERTSTKALSILSFLCL